MEELENSEKILNFLGFKYSYYLSVDYSDIGGVYSTIKIYSKEKLEHLVNTGNPDKDTETNMNKKYPTDVYVIKISDRWYSTDYPNIIDFKNDWNLLMIVVEYIENLQLDIFRFENTTVNIFMNYCDIIINKIDGKNPIYFYGKSNLSKIENTYDLILKFIDYVEEK